MQSKREHPYDLSIVVPVLNEAESLPELYQRLREVVGRVTNRWEIVFVDDGSTDRSFEVLAGMRQEDSRIKVIQLRRTYGKAAALTTGFKEAKGALILTMDADLQDRPEEIPRILAKLEEGHDLVCGWRVKRKDLFGKVLASRIFNSATRWLTGVRLHDMNCGLKGYRREVIDGLKIQGELHRYIPVIAQWQGFKVGEVEVEHHPRRHGASKYGREKFMRGFFDLLTAMILTRYLRRPLHLFGGLGLLFAAVGLVINLYLTVGWLLGKWWLGDRPLVLLGVLLMIIGVQFILFGLLAEIVAYTDRSGEEVPIRRKLV
ncbi:MAG: glycosyltransferase family 2 protein [Deltaproteobacteria bacterium]|nr:glycosyltransferase family 2 protein [Deltaproteobacteria bacterium]